MTLYRIVIVPEGPLASPLQSDTLFGAFCWSWLRLYGQESLEQEIIAPAQAGEPPVTFSNGFPHDSLPLPLCLRDKEQSFESLSTPEERKKAYQNEKVIKGAGYLSVPAFRAFQEGNWEIDPKEDLRKDIGALETTLHNMVSRDSGTVENIDGAGNLFGTDRRYFSPEQSFDCYMLTELDKTRLLDTITLMLSVGIGADKSTGCGVFHLTDEGLQEVSDFLECKGANGFVALSNFIPAPADPGEGWYQVLPKYPKLDHELAAGQHPFKKPMLFLKAGSTFRTEAVKQRYGRCLTGIAATELPVTVNACTIVLPCRLPDPEQNT